MTDQTATSIQRTRIDSRDLVVPPSILICAIAASVAAHLHLDLPHELAIVLGLLLLSLGLVAHVMLGRAHTRPTRVKRRRAVPSPAQDGADAEPTQDVTTPVWTQAAAPETTAHEVGDRTGNAGAEAGADASAQAAPAWDLRPADLDLAKIRRMERQQASGLDEDKNAEANAPAQAGLQAGQPLASEQMSPAPSAIAIDAADEAAEQARITTVLRRLATELRTGEPAPATTEIADASMAAAEPTPAVPEKPATSLSEAVDALRMTMEVMRNASPHAPAAPVAASEPPAIRSEAEIRLAAVAEALARERVQVFLEPIIGLADDSTRHFEVTVRLLGSDNRQIDTAILTQVPHGAEIVPLLDAVRVRHSAGIALKLERSGRDGTVFSEVAGPSLASERFVQGVADRQAQGIADRIVLTFLQNEVRGLGPAQLSALAGLRDLGFRFALQGIADLDMDFETLQASGFEFIKLDADVFLDGLPLLGGRVPSSDICRHFASLGMTVIVGRVDDEAMRARILGFGVLFGQGELFGGPRPLRITNAPRSQEMSGAAA